jgi:hypothetical protein
MAKVKPSSNAAIDRTLDPGSDNAMV